MWNTDPQSGHGIVLVLSDAVGDDERWPVGLLRERRYSDRLDTPIDGLALRAISRASTKAMISLIG